MGKKKAVFHTAMADEDQKTASGANASFNLMADYLGWEIVGRLNVGGCSTADAMIAQRLFFISHAPFLSLYRAAAPFDDREARALGRGKPLRGKVDKFFR